MSNSFIQIIESSEIIQIKQVRELAELFGFETRNKYSIKDQNGEEFGFCAEQSKGFGGFVLLQFLGHWRTFDLIANDRTNSQVFRANHPFRWIFQRLDVYRHGGRLIGSFQQRFSIFSKKFDILDSNGHVVMTMNSPFFKFWTFPIQKNGRTVAVIEKKWSGLLQEAFTDADNFRLRFTDRLSIDEKVLLLAGTIFVDLIYFEQNFASLIS